MSRDPIGERGGQNLTQFLRNDGSNQLDPIGLFVFEFLQGPYRNGVKSYRIAADILRKLSLTLAKQKIMDGKGSPCVLNMHEDVSAGLFRTFLPIEGTGRHVGNGAPDAVLLWAKTQLKASHGIADSMSAYALQDHEPAKHLLGSGLPESKASIGLATVSLNELIGSAPLYPDFNAMTVFLAGCGAHNAPAMDNRFAADNVEVEPFYHPGLAERSAKWVIAAGSIHSCLPVLSLPKDLEAQLIKDFNDRYKEENGSDEETDP